MQTLHDFHATWAYVAIVANGLVGVAELTSWRVGRLRGRWAEHDVSRASAVSVARALDPDRYDVVPVAITKEGRWLLAGEARAALDEGGRAELPTAFRVEGIPVAELPDPGSRTLVPLD